MARKAIEIASDKQATDIVLLDVREVCTFADYFVICNGQSERQIKVLSREIDKVLSQVGAALLRQEGTVDSGWILMDFSDVIVHVFGTQERDYYQLDRLWGAATPLLHIQ